MFVYFCTRKVPRHLRVELKLFATKLTRPAFFRGNGKIEDLEKYLKHRNLPTHCTNWKMSGSCLKIWTTIPGDFNGNAHRGTR